MAYNFSWNVLPSIFITIKSEWSVETVGKPSSSFDSDNIKISIYLLICSQRKLNLFLKELRFRCSNINLLVLQTRIFLRVLIAFETMVFEVLGTFSISIDESTNRIKSQFPSINCSKFFAKILLPFLFR